MPVHFAESTPSSCSAGKKPIFVPSQPITSVTAEQVKNMKDFSGQLWDSEIYRSCFAPERGSNYWPPQHCPMPNRFDPYSRAWDTADRASLAAYSDVSTALNDLKVSHAAWQATENTNNDIQSLAANLASCQESFRNSVAALQRYDGGRIFKLEIMEKCGVTHEEVEKYCQANTSECQSERQSNGAE